MVDIVLDSRIRGNDEFERIGEKLRDIAIATQSVRGDDTCLRLGKLSNERPEKRLKPDSYGRVSGLFKLFRG